MKKIEKLIAVLSDDGIFTIKRDERYYPLVMTDAVPIDSIVAAAQDAANEHNITLTVIEFTISKNLKVIKPNDKH